MTGGNSGSILPAIDAEQACHSDRVVAAVRAAAGQHEDWLRFDEYLRLVLYAPGLGYYSAGSVKLGPAGDFITAPELAPSLYPRCLARACAALLRSLGGGDVLELGAGTGRLAIGLLLRLAELGALPAHYYILEVSAELRARQSEVLCGLPDDLRRRVVWLDSLPDAPIAGVLLANEVADALPFRRFRIDQGRVLERGVAPAPDGALIEVDRPAEADLQTELERIAPAEWPPRYLSELCPLLNPWIASLAATLARGALLLFDYGLPRREYYHPQRDRGTLRCHFRHRAHEDPLLYPGLQDITAWVDFTRAAEAATESGLEVAGYCTQAAFLLATGIEAEVAAAVGAVERARLASQARALLLPGEMGETFKAMALTRGLEPPVPGFDLQDLRRSL